MLPYAATLITLITLLILPLWFIGSLWRARDSDRLLWVSKVVYTALFLGYLLEVGRWDFVSVYFRPIIMGAFVIACVRGWISVRARPWVAPATPTRTWSYAVAVALVAFFGGCFVFAASARLYDEPAVAMSFPLEGGRFYVGQGGSRSLMNYHHTTDSQRYALDIHELNRAGMRAAGAAPTELTSYAIFGNSVISPCSGRVATAVDRFPDLPPGDSDRENVAGNHVVIACDGLLVLLAHLRSGSVRVREGETVSVGSFIGEVGNSGNTSEPHLHFHAVSAESGDALNGTGVPVTFHGLFPVRNSLIDLG